MFQGFIYWLSVLNSLLWRLSWTFSLTEIGTVHTCKVSFSPFLNLSPTCRFHWARVIFHHRCFTGCLLLSRLTLLVGRGIGHQMIHVVWFHHLNKVFIFWRAFLSRITCYRRPIRIFDSRYIIFAGIIIKTLPYRYFLVPNPRIEDYVIFFFGVNKRFLHLFILFIKLLDVCEERALSWFNVQLWLMTDVSDIHWGLWYCPAPLLSLEI